jgi:hypothetical protein
MSRCHCAAAIILAGLISFSQLASADPAACNNLNWQNGFAPPQRAALSYNYTMMINSADSPATPGPYYLGTPVYLVQLAPSQAGPYTATNTTKVQLNNSGTAEKTIGAVNFANVTLAKGALYQTQFPSRGTYQLAIATGLQSPLVGDYNICNKPTYTTLVQTLPTVTLVSTPGTQAEVGKSLSFTVSGEKDSQSVNSQISYEWNFGDGTGSQSTFSTTISHTFVSNGTFNISVRAFDGGYYSDIINLSLTVVGPTPPSLVTEAVSCANSYWTIELNWSPTNSYPIGHYEVEASQNQGAWTQIYTGNASSTQHQAYKNTNQRYRVRACSTTDGCSLMSNISNVTLPNNCNVQ